MIAIRFTRLFNFESVQHLTSPNSTVEEMKGCNFKTLTCYSNHGFNTWLVTQRNPDHIPEEKSGKSSGPSIKDVSERQFYPRVQKASGHVYLEFNTNLQHAVSIPRPLGFESHIKHLTLDFYTFRVKENPPPKKGRNKSIYDFKNTKAAQQFYLSYLRHVVYGPIGIISL